ncbi:hypothetical protein TcWFU_007636 [Taenia crassiceps]|uniref:WASP family protein member n=1 Tax=Taenia crassiceps TaxID=6207 RepID=A0ABR4QM08_9CEST
MRLSECVCFSENALILDSLFDPEERRIYIKCVPKQDVSQFVSWNNCISTKYSKASNVNSEIFKSTLPHVISRKKKRAPLPPPPRLDRYHKGSCTSDEFTQLIRQDSATSMESGDRNYQFLPGNLARGISQTSSQWSIYDEQMLADSFSSITIKPGDNYLRESPISEDVFTSKAVTPLLAGTEVNYGSPSAKSQTAPNPPSLTAANKAAPSVTEKSLFKDETPVQTAHERALLGSLQHSSHIPPSTPELASAPQKASTLQSIKAPREDPALRLTEDHLKQARAALKSIPPRKLTTLPLRRADGKNRPAFLSNCDRSEDKDWSSRFWCTDRRSQTLNFTISKYPNSEVTEDKEAQVADNTRIQDSEI